jgi:hypothetical protein
VKPDSAGLGGAALSFREYAKHVSDVVWLGGIPWYLYGRVLMPLCMPHVPVEVDRVELRRAIVRHKALLACWTTEWDAFDASEWWWTVCDHSGYDVENISSSNGRASIRQGLRHCTARCVQAAEFPRLAYPIYRAAVERYGDRPPTEQQFAEGISRMAAYSGTEFWGAFRGDTMAAYATCRILDGAVELISAKSDSGLHRYEPNSALFYTMCKHYLELNLRYVSNGSRTLWHPTDINTFLQKLGFRRVYCRVEVELSVSARIVDAAKLASWGPHVGLKRLLGVKWAQLEGFDQLMRIAEAFR